jgi:hypothetical protein
MENRYHPTLEKLQSNLLKAMHGISGYTGFFNRKYNRGVHTIRIWNFL